MEKPAKRKKLDKNTTYEDLLLGWTRCCFLLTHKQRLCNLERSPHSRYCGAHRPAEEESLETSNQPDVSKRRKRNNDDERIPCPLDPAHTIFKRFLSNHLKICNAAKIIEHLQSLPYYKPNCNGGTILCEEVSNQTEMADPSKLLQKVDAAYEKIPKTITETVYKKPIITDLDESQIIQLDQHIRAVIGGDQTSFYQLRHVEQDIAIVHIMLQNKILRLQNPQLDLDSNLSVVSHKEEIPSSNNVYLEFGAGKGLLGYAVYLCDPNAKLGLIERSSNKKKIDKFLTEKGAQFARFRMDIRDCFVPLLPCVVDSLQQHRDGLHSTAPQIVVMAKHLCGVASDLAIRSIANLDNNDPVKSDSNLLTASKKLCSRAVAIATCCHHACQYDDYTGHKWLMECSITRDEFEIIKFWSGWANLPTDGTSSADSCKTDSDPVKDTSTEANTDHACVALKNDIPRPVGLSQDAMKVYGKKIKRILDYGRVLYLQGEVGFNHVNMVKYCDDKLSPECMLIIASDES